MNPARRLRPTTWVAAACVCGALAIGAIDVTHAAEPAADETDAGAPTSTFTESFDGSSSSPTPFDSDDWDVTVHSRAPATWESLDAVDAAHGPDCGPPPASHRVTSYADAVFICKDHMMTAIRGDAYGVVYLTPDHMVDFSTGEAIISVDVSTLRTSARDWWDIWITPYDDALQLPLELDASADLSGPPRRAIRVGLGTENQMLAEIFDDFTNVAFPNWPEQYVTGDTFTGYETFLKPDAKRRDTFEIRISSGHLRVGMPEYDFWWIDTDIPEISWTQGVVQFGHHSYNPTKDCNIANNPRPPVDECLPTTWHWDNVSITPARPFTIIPSTARTAGATQPDLEFDAPAPPGAHLRFAGVGEDMRVQFDDSDWVSATPQATLETTREGHFTSYWVDIPAGTTTVGFDADDWYSGEWHVRDASIWADQRGAPEAVASCAPIEVCRAISDAVSEMWSAFERVAARGRS